MTPATMTKVKHAAPCSHEEYDALPEQLKRKCFSTVERLRLEEEHVLHLHHHHQRSQSLHPHAHPYNNPPTNNHSNSQRPRSRAASLSLTLRSGRCLRKPKSLKDDRLAAKADAEFFLSLPDKVRRSHFSREEQIILVGSYSPAASFSSPLPESRSQHSEDANANNNRFADFHFDFDFASNQVRGRSHSRSSSLSSIEPISPMRDSVCRPRLPTSHHQHQFDAMSSSSHSRPSSSYQRTRSLTHLPHRISTSSAPPPIDSHLSNRMSIWHQRSHSQSLSGRRSSTHTPQVPVFDPEATHWKDPEARKKLRTLASPQKFDEAVEFGFASTDRDYRPAAAHYQLPPIATDARNFSHDMQTFLKDDRISFLEDNEDDDDDEDEEDKGLESDKDSVADLDSPVTPSSGLSFRCHTRHQSSNFSSIDSNGLPANAPINPRPNREMTLRMTLTRPDLRADEEQLYGWQALQGSKSPSSDPFALEELQLTDDMSGTKGPFYVKPKSQGTLVSRLFKRASRKSR